jgi:glycerol-3-phosphate dehydrogenase (NAD(P)+)
MSQVAILGAGSWGTALAVLWSHLHPKLWDHNAQRARQVTQSRRSDRFLPDIALPAAIDIVSDLETALAGVDTAVLATPSHALRGLARQLAALPDWKSDMVILAATKGLEESTGKRTSEILAEELPQAASHILSLVGPSHAEEVARGIPTSVVLAGSDPDVLESRQDLLSTAAFRIYTNTDALGVELAVSMKNVIAIAAGIADGLGFGDNTKGALLTRGLAEMTRLGVAMGARPETFAGLAGLGDLVTTAISRHSRNRNLGEALGKGATLEAAIAATRHVAEGVRTTKAALELARTHAVELPITQQVHDILFANKEPRQAIRDLMLRTPKSEVSSAPKGVT